MAKLDLTKQFYEIAKAAGPGDYSSIYQHQAQASMAISQNWQRTIENVEKQMAARNAYLGKIRANFENIGREMLQKLSSTGAGGNDETLNTALFDTSFDYFQDLADEYEAVSTYGGRDTRENKKARMLIEAKAVKAVNILTRLRADIVTMSTKASSGAYSAGGNGNGVKLEVITRIMNQGNYDDVEPIWSEDGLTFRVTTDKHGVLELNAGDLLGSLKGPAYNTEGKWIGLGGKAQKLGTIENSFWNQDEWNSEVLKMLEDAKSNDEITAFLNDPHFGSKNSFADDLVKSKELLAISISPTLLNQVNENIIQYDEEHTDFTGWLQDTDGDGLDLKDLVDNPDVEKDQGELNMRLLMRALTQPDAPGYNEGTTFDVAKNYYTNQLRQQFDVGKETLRKQELNKVFEEEGKTIDTHDGKKNNKDVMATVEKVNTYTAFFDWKGKKWSPIGGDAWISSEWEEDTYTADTTPVTRETLLGSKLIIPQHLWGTTTTFTPTEDKFLVSQPAQEQINNVLSNVSLGSKPSFGKENYLFKYEQNVVARTLTNQFGRPNKHTPGWTFEEAGGARDWITAILWDSNGNKLVSKKFKVDKRGRTDKHVKKVESDFINWLKTQTKQLVPEEQIRNRAQE